MASRRGINGNVEKQHDGWESIGFLETATVVYVRMSQMAGTTAVGELVSESFPEHCSKTVLYTSMVEWLGRKLESCFHVSEHKK